MDKKFWLAIRENKFAFPTGNDLAALTDELFSYISDLDPELRDSIGYEIFSNWIETEPYSPELLRGYIQRLTANLQIGLGERDTDTVFQRSFSALFLAEVIHRDNKEAYLTLDEVTDVLNRVLDYLASERDPRGFVPVKGWAHALAHTADLLMVFARSPHVDGSDLLHILEAISAKMRVATDWVYVHGEDDRLARTIVTAFGRDLISVDQVIPWLATLTADWKTAWENEKETRAYFNTRNLLRALHLRVLSSKDLPHREELASLLLESTTTMRPF